ncbi:MAG: bifunctional (p)ppGpp synthetase/guanosine-3',5'-bis(diphosphate) 3'-pyrophosphohydrolase [Patescibacteria group bacterium]|jgi:GTP pyrophosphokinase
MDTKLFFDKAKILYQENELEQIKKAFTFANNCHAGQFRESKEPYITHPLKVALFLIDMNLDATTIIAALLHDTVEDTSIKLEDIKKEFGNEVAKLVSGVTKLKQAVVYQENIKSYSAENIRRMFLAMAQDIRVVLIKLADRYHNMATLNYKEPKKRQEKARETLDIYAPLANRLCMGELKGQLEDYAFPILMPNEYNWVKSLTQKKIEERKKYISKVIIDLKRKLKNANIEYIDIHGRAKHYYSLYKKLLRNNKNINEIYDIVALRVVVKDVPTCYTVLGFIHQNWRPLIGRIKDYIALPKTNGYQSIHTTVIRPDGEIIEIQIKTSKMHEEAECGIAAHWQYDEAGKPKNPARLPAEKIAWIKKLTDWQKELPIKNRSEKFAESLKIDIFKDRIFAFTPKGDVLDLPENATPIDFAYQVHTEIGHRCKEVWINGHIASLDNKIKNGDVVNIITSSIAKPKRDWLTFAKTSIAQSKIKTWFKQVNKDKNIAYGKKILNNELAQLGHKPIETVPKNKITKALQKLNYIDLDGLFTALGEGEINLNQVIKAVYEEKDILKKDDKQFLFFKKEPQPRAIISDTGGFLTKIAKCCNPTINDKIKAHITRSEGASIHKYNCKELKKPDQGRIVDACWDQDLKENYHAKIEVESLNRIGMIKDIATLLSNFGVNIENFHSKSNPKKDTFIMCLHLEIKNLDQFFEVLHEVSKIEGIIDVRRI